MNVGLNLSIAIYKPRPRDVIAAQHEVLTTYKAALSESLKHHDSSRTSSKINILIPRYQILGKVMPLFPCLNLIIPPFSYFKKGPA